MRSASSKRKPVFILLFFAFLAAVAAFLAFKDIPAPVSEQVIELDAAHVLKQ